MSKTAPDGDNAGELHEVTTEAHTQTAKNSDGSPDREGKESVESAPHASDASRSNDRAAESGDSDFENFASRFRPSWAPDDAPLTPSIPAPVHASGPARVVRVGTRSDLSVPKLRKHRGAAYGILGASVVGVAGLMYLAIASSSTHPGPAHRVETSVHAAQRPQAPATVKPRDVEAAPAAPAAAPEPLAMAAEQVAEAPAADPAPAAEPAPDTSSTADTAAAAEATAAQPPAAAPAEVASAAATPAGAAPAPTTASQPPAAAAAQTPAAAAPAAGVAVAAAPAQPAAVPSQPAPAAAKPAPAQAAPAAAALAAAPSTQPALKPLPPSAAEQAPARPANVTLSLAAFPPNTQLRIDGGTVPNPFRMRLPRESKHRIEARAPGFLAETHVLRMDADVQLMISLKRDQAAARDVKADPYKDARQSAANAQGRPRGAGFVSENPY